jgi:hypothetical protein
MNTAKVVEAQKHYLDFRADGWNREDALYMASVVAQLNDEECAELWRRC